jgi:high-affinity K+ transport system ATPase subunit B
MIAMTGDGTTTHRRCAGLTPVAMNTGTTAARVGQTWRTSTATRPLISVATGALLTAWRADDVSDNDVSGHSRSSRRCSDDVPALNKLNIIPADAGERDLAAVIFNALIPSRSATALRRQYRLRSAAQMAVAPAGTALAD